MHLGNRSALHDRLHSAYWYTHVI